MFSFLTRRQAFVHLVQTLGLLERDLLLRVTAQYYFSLNRNSRKNIEGVCCIVENDNSVNFFSNRIKYKNDKYKTEKIKLEQKNLKRHKMLFL